MDSVKESPRIVGGRRLAAASAQPSLLDSLRSNASTAGGGGGGGAHSTSASASSSRREKIWVGVRIRPLHPHEVEEGAAWKASDATTLTHLDPAASSASGFGGGSSSYSYDRVFAEAASSAEVYTASSQRLVVSAMEGYNSTLFAYGQTGSGKTHTMRVIMRSAAADIFRSVRAAGGREFLLRLSAMEIYNEIVWDLLKDDRPAQGLKVMDDQVRGTAAEGLTEAFVLSESHLEDLLAAVERRRHVRDTRMNASSSRSHQIVRIHIESKPATHSVVGGYKGAEEGEASAVPPTPTSRPHPRATDGSGGSAASGSVTLSVINFVDLAGSERLSQAGALEDSDKEKLRAKEASNINRSLLTLGTVIRALGDSTTRKHVSYRDSKLTRLLQPSLSGNSRMAIICNISPAAGSAENTRAALNFANEAKKVTMRPKVNEVADDKVTIRNMLAEIQELKEQLGGQGWFTERSQLKGALKQSEERVRLTGEQKEKAEKQLANMQQFVLRGGDPAAHSLAHHGRRPSFDAILNPAPDAAVVVVRTASAALRASWNLGDPAKRPLLSGPSAAVTPTPAAPSRAGAAAAAAVRRGSPAPADTLLLDFFLPPAVRRACDRASSVVVGASIGSVGPSLAAPGGSGGAAAAGSGQPALSALLQRLPVPTGAAADEALVALQAEVRCISHSSPPAAAAAGPRPSGIPSATQRPAAAAARSSGGAATAAGRTSQSEGAEEVTAMIAHLTRELRRLEAHGDTATSQQAAGAAPSGEDEVELLRAVRTELARLQQREAADRTASSALASLTLKVTEPAAGDGTLPGLVNGAPSPVLPEWLDVFFHQSLEGGPGAASSPRRFNPQDDTAGGYDVPPSGSPGTPRGTFTDQQTLKGGRASGGAAAGGLHHRQGSMLRGGDQDTAQPQASSSTSLDRPSPWSAAAGRPSTQADSTPGVTPMSTTSDDLLAGGAMNRWDSGKVKVALKNQRESVTAWYRGEVSKVREAFRVSAERDVEALGAAVGQYKEQLERITLQKKMLLNQVLKLELDAEDHQRDAEDQQWGAEQLASANARVEQLERDVEQFVSANARALSERDQARFDAAQARASTRAAIATANASAAIAAAGRRRDDSEDGVGSMAERLDSGRADEGCGPRALDEIGVYDAHDDTWADEASAETLLPKIIDLWEALHVPLVYRSRFVRAFKGKEVFYYEMEFRRMEWKRSQAVSNGSLFGKSREMERAARALDWERKSLAANLKWNLDEEEREQLYQEWGINRNAKERKMSLVSMLWAPRTLAIPDGLQRCVDLVILLSGTDAAEQFLELVFCNGEAVTRPSALGVVVKSLVASVAAGGGGGTPKRRSPGGASTPRRNSNSSQGVAGVASRVMSFMSLRRPSESMPLDRSILSGITGGQGR